jgi:zinc protease
VILLLSGAVAAEPDRSAPPEVLPSPVLELPEPVIHEIGPSATAWYVRVPQVRKVALDLVLLRGMIELDGRPTESARALGWMAEVAAGDLDAAEMSLQRDVFDITVDSSIGMHAGQVALRVPREELARGVALQNAVLRDPTFPKKDLKRYLRDQKLFYTVSGPSSQAAVARSALAFAWFPADHPYGQRPDLTSLDRIKRGDLRARFDEWRHAAPLVAIVVGDVAWDEIADDVKTLVDGLGSPGVLPEQLPFEPLGTSRVVAVDMKGQQQVALRMRMAAPWQDDPDRAAYQTASWILGGHFLSRLNSVLREEKGYTYGANATWQNGPTWGSFTVSVDVRPENLLDTIRTIEDELAAMATTGPVEAEMVMARRSLTAEWNDTFLTADTAISLYRRVLEEESTVAEQRADVAALEDMTPEEVRAVAARWLDPHAARTWVLVGDRDAMAPTVETIGLPVQWTNPASAILGTFDATSGDTPMAGER